MINVMKYSNTVYLNREFNKSSDNKIIFGEVRGNEAMQVINSVINKK